MIRTQTMWCLDRFVGGFFCSLLARLQVPHRQRAPNTSTTENPVLFIGLAEMGSTILADPALRHARDIYGSTPCFSIFHHNAASLELTGTVSAENTFTIRADNLLTLAVDTLRFMLWCRRRGIKTAVDIDPCSNFSALLTLLSGAWTRVGLKHGSGKGRERIYTCGTRYQPDQHLSLNLLSLVDAALAPAPPRGRQSNAPVLPDVSQHVIHENLQLETLRRLQARNAEFEPGRHRILLINPNQGDLLPQRRWPRENYLKLIDGILGDYPDVCIFVLGTQADASKVAELVEEIGNPRCSSIAGAFSLNELPALFACSKVMLSSDAGPAHFAAVTTLPVVALFGPETPVRYSPLGNATTLTANLACSPCIHPNNRRPPSCQNNRCMSAISVGRVLGEVERHLGKDEACLTNQLPPRATPAPPPLDLVAPRVA